MNLLVLLNGNPEIILKNNGFSTEEFEIIKVDEKSLYDFNKIVKILNSGNYKSVYFGCLDAKLQRFLEIMYLMIAKSSVKSGGIIDQYGLVKKFSKISCIFKILPHLIFEAFYAIICVLFYHPYLLILKWKMTKKS